MAKGLIAKSTRTYIDPEVSNFKKGLDLQRELFKRGKSGSGVNNFDLMCDSLENIKSEIKSRLCDAGHRKIIKKVEMIITWYRNKEELYSRNTEEGVKIVFPSNMNERINKNLTIAYEILIKYMDKLGLL